MQTQSQIKVGNVVEVIVISHDCTEGVFVEFADNPYLMGFVPHSELLHPNNMCQPHTKHLAFVMRITQDNTFYDLTFRRD